MVNKFHTYYQNLYNNMHAATQEDFEDFVSRLPMPTLSGLHRKAWDSDTQAEVFSGIRVSKTAKAPGPDGFTALYYKKYSPLLVPH